MMGFWQEYHDDETLLSLRHSDEVLEHMHAVRLLEGESVERVSSDDDRLLPDTPCPCGLDAR
jgi:hypothetical protein